jgi:hypothetical protein
MDVVAKEKKRLHLQEIEPQLKNIQFTKYHHPRHSDLGLSDKSVPGVRRFLQLKYNRGTVVSGPAAVAV